MTQVDPFWSLAAADAMQRLASCPEGLTSTDAQARLERYGSNSLGKGRDLSAIGLFLRQFGSPIILILIFAALLSAFLGDLPDAAIILGIVLASGLLGFFQERGARGAVKRLMALVETKATVLRDGKPQDVPLEAVVPGDVVILNAGDLIPGDSLLLSAKDLFVSEASLTGETYPVEKNVGVLSVDTPLAGRSNALFMGSSVVSGSATALVVHTGLATELGKVAGRLKLRAPESDFERGVRRFGTFLMEVTLLLVIAIFAVNVFLDRPILDAFLFSLALAVGLTPQLLPAIISINLSQGARRMAAAKVIVKRLTSIENFGAMNVLCSDKTGTLTEGVVRLDAALDSQGQPSDKVLLYAYLNATFETGFNSPIDEAIRAHGTLDLSDYEKLDEVPYDFVRKRLTVFVAHGGERFMTTKGAFTKVLEVCTTVETERGLEPLEAHREELERRYQELSRQGFRMLGIAYRKLAKELIGKSDEEAMTFLGFLSFSDPPKAGIKETVAALQELGVSLKVITGDNRLVAATVAEKVGLAGAQVLSGPELRKMSDEALMARAPDVAIFAEVEPNQKERIILALKKAGDVVGYLGDGINDASALHAADVGISVNGAVDVAKEAADLVLLEADLGVLLEGVKQGRATFANTLKYVFMATSANFGNMFSMAGASLLLPFLPLLPKQILFINLLTDLPETAIASDRVDRELMEKPRRWDLAFIRRFMLVFGSLSSLFDFLTFAVLLALRASPEQFRTGWFVESVISATLVVLVVRTRRAFYRSPPSLPLLLATLAVIAATSILPYTPVAEVFGFVPLPPHVLGLMLAIVALYVLAAELAKRAFYRRNP